MKTAIVYDRVNKWGGAERVLLVLHEMFPNAPLYTSVYDPETAPWAEVFPQVHTSFLQNIPFAKKNHEVLAPLMPLAFERFNFEEYDLVISVSSEAAKGIITKPQTKHVCICLTPTRYLWSGYGEYFKNPILRSLSRPLVGYLRRWDLLAAQRPDIFIAISTVVKKRIKEYYRRDSHLIHPPATSLAKPEVASGNYFLVVARLVPYKRVDLVVNAFNCNRLPLVVIGRGSQQKKLQKMARQNITFLKPDVSDDRSLAEYYAGCRALIFPQEEDFGLVAVEAMSLGRPVIAFRAGGALDIIQEGVNGMFFEKQTVDCLNSAIDKFDRMTFHSDKIVGSVLKFSKENFKQKLFDILN